MKKLIVFMFSVFLLVSCGELIIDEISDEYRSIDISPNGKVTYNGEPFSGVLTNTYKSGNLNYKRTYKDGKKNGFSEGYHKNGHIKYREPYKNGEKDGVWERYYENGQLKSKTTFKDGRRVD
jgi:antitoxin component YwqK of YwqJK toxin-antitoxin module